MPVTFKMWSGNSIVEYSVEEYELAKMSDKTLVETLVEEFQDSVTSEQNTVAVEDYQTTWLSPSATDRQLMHDLEIYCDRLVRQWRD